MKFSIIHNTELNEKIKEISNYTLCDSNINCRSYQEILDIATCKSSRFANELALDKDLYYILTWYKPKAIHEWAKFLYAIVENKNTNLNPYQGNMQFIKLLFDLLLQNHELFFNLKEFAFLLMQKKKVLLMKNVL